MKKRPDPSPHLLFALAMLNLGCASRTLPGAAVIPAENRAVMAIVRQALERDASGETAVQFYDPFATVVANGAERRDAPRFAGIEANGSITIAELRGEVVGEFAWAAARYQWTSADRRVVESGHATFVLAREGDTWHIRHAHSSVVPPWGDARN